MSLRSFTLSVIIWLQNNGMCSHSLVLVFGWHFKDLHLFTLLTVSCLWFWSEDHKRFDEASLLDPLGPGSHVTLSVATNETALLISNSTPPERSPACTLLLPYFRASPECSSWLRWGRRSIKSSPRWANIQIYWASPMEGGGCWKTPECHWT